MFFHGQLTRPRPAALIGAVKPHRAGLFFCINLTHVTRLYACTGVLDSTFMPFKILKY